METDLKTQTRYAPLIGSLLLIASNSAFADASAESSMSLVGRIGPTVGTYQGEVKVRIADVNNVTLIDETVGGDSELMYGFQGGLTASDGRLFLDLALDYLRVELADEKVDRTDLTFTGGFKLGSNGSFFAGYRIGAQGDGVFNDDNFEESGPFIGAGLGGLSAGPLYLGASAAFNFSNVDDFPVPGEDLDYDGISVKFSAALKSMPSHSLQLRIQQFEGDGSVGADTDMDGDADLRTDFELEETYLQLYYIYSFVI